MKIKELVTFLSSLPNQELEVIISKDAEGNGYNRISEDSIGTENCAFTKYIDGNIVVGIFELTKERMEQGYTDEDIRMEQCITNYPN